MPLEKSGNIDKDFYQQLLRNGHLDVDEETGQEIEASLGNLRELLEKAYDYRDTLTQYQDMAIKHDLEKHTRELGREIKKGARALSRLEELAEENGAEKLYEEGETAFMAAVITGEFAHYQVDGLRTETPADYARKRDAAAREMIPEDDEEWEEMLTG